MPFFDWGLISFLQGCGCIQEWGYIQADMVCTFFVLVPSEFLWSEWGVPDVPCGLGQQKRTTMCGALRRRYFGSYFTSKILFLWVYLPFVFSALLGL